MNKKTVRITVAAALCGLALARAYASEYGQSLAKLRADGAFGGSVWTRKCEKGRARVRRLAAQGFMGTPRYRRAVAVCQNNNTVLARVFADNEKVNRDELAAGHMTRFVPYINQHEPRNAPSSYNGHFHCGKTTMAMIARAFGFGREMADADLINFFGKKANSLPAHGFSLKAWDRMTRAAGLNAAMKGPKADVAWIAEQLKAGKLVAALGVYAAMPPHQNLSKVSAAGTGHYIAVVGRDGAGNFLVNDPADPIAKVLTPSQLETFLNAVPARRAKGTCAKGQLTCEGWQIAIGPGASGHADHDDSEARDSGEETPSLSSAQGDAYWDEN